MFRKRPNNPNSLLDSLPESIIHEPPKRTRRRGGSFEKGTAHARRRAQRTNPTDAPAQGRASAHHRRRHPPRAAVRPATPPEPDPDDLDEKRQEPLHTHSRESSGLFSSRLPIQPAPSRLPPKIDTGPGLNFQVRDDSTTDRYTPTKDQSGNNTPPSLTRFQNEEHSAPLTPPAQASFSFPHGGGPADDEDEENDETSSSDGRRSRQEPAPPTAMLMQGPRYPAPRDSAEADLPTPPNEQATPMRLEKIVIPEPPANEPPSPRAGSADRVSASASTTSESPRGGDDPPGAPARAPARRRSQNDGDETPARMERDRPARPSATPDEAAAITMAQRGVFDIQEDEAELDENGDSVVQASPDISPAPPRHARMDDAFQIGASDGGGDSSDPMHRDGELDGRVRRPLLPHRTSTMSTDMDPDLLRALDDEDGDSTDRDTFRRNLLPPHHPRAPVVAPQAKPSREDEPRTKGSRVAATCSTLIGEAAQKAFIAFLLMLHAADHRRAWAVPPDAQRAERLAVPALVEFGVLLGFLLLPMLLWKAVLGDLCSSGCGDLTERVVSVWLPTVLVFAALCFAPPILAPRLAESRFSEGLAQNVAET